MLVNSIIFCIFFLVVLLPYFSVLSGNSKLQNLWILVASYFFYAYADWRMVALLLAATVLFYLLGRGIENCQKKKESRRAKMLMISGVVAGVGLLLYFKYLNFFIEQFSELFALFGLKTNWSTFQLIVPIGISFFTFKLISYVVEIYKNNIHSERDFVDFAAYIAFFPTIMSGPIDKANDFLPQLKTQRTWSNAMVLDGCKRVLWGMFLKMCIADNLAMITDQAWMGYSSMSSSALLAAALLYPLQLYADFDGYSNMAIGVGKILGFNVTRNFNHPFLARNMAEYWRRWHMSLTSWITDYVFMPLNIAFREIGNWGIALAAIINLLVIGLWHGANWTYAVFGLYHGLLFIPLVFSGAFGKKKKLKANAHGFPQTKDFFKMLATYVLVMIGHVIFRAPTISQAYDFLAALFTNGMTGVTLIDNYGKLYCLFTIILLIFEWIQRDKEYTLQLSSTSLFRHRIIRWGLYLFLILLIITFTGQSQAFIYFQF